MVVLVPDKRAAFSTWYMYCTEYGRIEFLTTCVSAGLCFGIRRLSHAILGLFERWGVWRFSQYRYFVC